MSVCRDRVRREQSDEEKRETVTRVVRQALEDCDHYRWLEALCDDSCWRSIEIYKGNPAGDQFVVELKTYWVSPSYLDRHPQWIARQIREHLVASVVSSIAGMEWRFGEVVTDTVYIDTPPRWLVRLRRFFRLH